MTHEGRRALVIVHEPSGPGGRIEERLRQRGLDIDSHVVLPGDDPNAPTPWPDLSGYDLIVPMGSYHSLTRKHEIDRWVHHELGLLTEAHHRGQALLGVCFGGQLIADAFGGGVVQAATTEMGWYELTDGPDGPNPVGPGPWFEWHHDRIEPPPEAEVLAVTADAVQLIRLGTTVGTQFHPEVDVSRVAAWLAEASEGYLSSHGVTAPAMLADARRHEDRNIGQCHALVDWYLDEVAFPTG